MPTTTQLDAAPDGTPTALSPLRRSRNALSREQHVSRRVERDGPIGDERRDAPGAPLFSAGDAPTPLPAQPLVLAPRAVVVAFDGGPCGRAALAFALRSLPGQIVVAHVWSDVDAGRLAAVTADPAAGPQVLGTVERARERTRIEAERIAAHGVALAQEAGRDATPVAIAAPDGASRTEALAAWAEDQVAGHLILGRPRSERRRWSRARTAVERVAATAPCPVTVVPVDAG